MEAILVKFEGGKSEAKSLEVGGYGLASGLVGFRSSDLRVKVTRIDGNYIFVVTADLLDAGTALVLDAGQVVGI
jgi:hypothetical protein